MTAVVSTGPHGMRGDLVPVLRELSDAGPAVRKDRALTLERIVVAMRDAGLSAVGVGELELLADAIRTGGWS